MTQDEAFQHLVWRLEHARRKHPVFALNQEEAALVIRDEYRELEIAVFGDEGPERVVDEALDVAATAMRLVMGEQVKR